MPIRDAARLAAGTPASVSVPVALIVVCNVHARSAGRAGTAAAVPASSWRWRSTTSRAANGAAPGRSRPASAGARSSDPAHCARLVSREFAEECRLETDRDHQPWRQLSQLSDRREQAQRPAQLCIVAVVNRQRRSGFGELQATERHDLRRRVECRQSRLETVRRGNEWREPQRWVEDSRSDRLQPSLHRAMGTPYG